MNIVAKSVLAMTYYLIVSVWLYGNSPDCSIASHSRCMTALIRLCLIDHLWEHCGSDFPWLSTQPQTSGISFHSCVNVRQSYKHMLMAMDTCEYFTVGPLSLSYSHTHSHTFIYLFSKLPKSHLRLLEWVYVVKVGGFPCDYSLRIILCESSPYVC